MPGADQRVLVPRESWPPDRFPHWAVGALRAAGAHVAVRDRSPRRWDVAFVPAVAAPGSGGVRAARVVGLLDRAPLPGQALLRGELVAASHALAAAAGRPARVVRPAVAAAGWTAGAGDGVFTVTSVAPLHWSAGHEHAVVAVASLIAAGRPVELRVAGDGPLREAVLYTAFDLGISAALRIVPAAGALAEADAFLLAATEDGVWPGLLEAFAAGVPAVASDLPTVRELGGGEAALLVPPRAPARIAAALGALAGDAGRRAELAARGRAVAVTGLAACGHGLLGT